MSPNSPHNAVAGNSAQPTAGTVQCPICRSADCTENDAPRAAPYTHWYNQCGVNFVGRPEATALTRALVVDAICGCAAVKPAMFDQSSLTHDASEIVRALARMTPYGEDADGEDAKEVLNQLIGFARKVDDFETVGKECSDAIGNPTAAELLADPAVSFWIKDALNALSQRDPVDALHDAELLVRVARARLAALPF